MNFHMHKVKISLSGFCSGTARKTPKEIKDLGDQAISKKQKTGHWAESEILTCCVRMVLNHIV